MNDRKEKKEESPLGRRGSAQMKELICTWRKMERGGGKYLQNERGTKIFTGTARARKRESEDFFARFFFFLSVALLLDGKNFQTRGKVEEEFYFSSFFRLFMTGNAMGFSGDMSTSWNPLWRLFRTPYTHNVRWTKKT